MIGREIPVNLDLDGFDFVGFIDRLDRDDRTGAVSIFDYKTGSIATSAAEYREEVRRFADFQLPFYYWARTAAGDRVSRLALDSAQRRACSTSCRSRSKSWQVARPEGNATAPRAERSPSPISSARARA